MRVWNSTCDGILKVVAANLVLLFALAGQGCAGETHHADAPLHHTENGFRNHNLAERRDFLDFLKWQWERLGKDIRSADSYSFPLADNDPEFLRENSTEITVTWIGHATLLVQIGGKNILTDPHFSERASPVQWAGPKRAVPPGMTLDELPRIDTVLLSHDHYDSLDDETIRRLRQRAGGADTVFYVPLGFRPWFEDRGVSNLVELDWWETSRSADGFMRVTAVPMQHWSKRTMFSRNKRLWAGWVVEVGGYRFFFAGDSGYGPHFIEIGERLGPFDLSAIPIGAYEPRWFMKRHHMDPEEAVKVHRDVGSRKSLAIHWGTFVLTDEPLDEPPRRLGEAMRQQGVPEDAFVVLKHGETIFPER